MSLVGSFNQQLNPQRGVTSFGFTPLPRPQNNLLPSWFPDSDSEDTISNNKDYDRYIGDEDKFEERLWDLAQTFSRPSTSAETIEITDPTNVFAGIEGTELDPNSPKFNSKAWIKNLLAIRSDDPERYPDRSTGIVFRDLGVHGFGSPTDYQKDVLNIVLEIGTFFRYLTGTARRKIQILKGFDGLVKSGEMLVVLGRPGR